ncbi:MAG: PspC domain-containing protein [Vicingaceae bacterium]
MLARPKKRVFAGVCEALGLHFKLPTNLIRIAFILLSISTTIPIFIYLALLLILPNYDKISNQKELNRLQTNGLLIGGFIAGIAGFIFPYIIFEIKSLIILIIIGIFLIPFGAFVGYLVAKIIIERRN